MLLKSNINDLKKILKCENVLSNPEELYCYAQDSTHVKELHQIPDVVVFVETTEEIQKVLKYANQHLIPVVARGAGTNMVGACVCNNGGIVLNFSKMNKILDFNPINMTMKVQPGVVLNDVKKLAETKGLTYPPDPSNYRVSTIGGSIAQSSGGAKAFKYGTTKDYILSLKVVLADGTIIKLGNETVKDAVGYHLNQLIIGSEGTLAIVAEADLKLIPNSAEKALIVAYYNSYSGAVDSVNAILTNNIFPATIDFMDQNAVQTVVDFMSSSLKTTNKCLVLFEIEGFNQDSIDSQLKKSEDILSSTGAVDVCAIVDETEMDKIWTARRSSYAAAIKLAPNVVSDDIIVPRSNLAEMIDWCKTVADEYSLNVCIVGHIGDGNIHPQFVLDLNDDMQYRNYLSAKAKIYKKAISLGGTISSEHGVGLEKISYAEQVIDEYALEYMKSIKKIFDPNNILNPGKIFKV